MKIPTFRKSATTDKTVMSPTEGEKKLKKSKKKQRSTGNGDGTVVQSWASDAGRFVVYGVAALVSLGALCGVLAFNRPAPAIQKVTSSGITVQQQQAGAFAQTYLSAWLSSTSNDHKELDKYIGLPGSSFVGNETTEYRDMTVASIKEAPGNLNTVVVSASIKTTATDDKGVESTTWTPYWYQVVVQSKDGSMAPAGLPAPIAMPVTTTAPNLGYSSRVANTEIQATVADFMSAYLTGQGDVTRYTSPETAINAITPAYWTDAKIKSIQSAAEVSSSTPTAGQTAEILVDMNLTRNTTTKPAQYVLDLKVRDGRWEIQSLKPAPVLSR